MEALTPSERRIAGMASERLSNPQIAQSLFVSLKTVETNAGHALPEARHHSRAELSGALSESALDAQDQFRSPEMIESVLAPLKGVTPANHKFRVRSQGAP